MGASKATKDARIDVKAPGAENSPSPTPGTDIEDPLRSTSENADSLADLGHASMSPEYPRRSEHVEQNDMLQNGHFRMACVMQM
ncbi:hypothetical protein NDU88_005647 [Pleurodeles waltl]|uniref:Uncharacterized protein n=1 Tax=Pleurodeles waltl TaxID=8319 RepID=A0AAV7WC32_PLEWA|nr:hypothetical protein NDU88_005647 [Pleurodeles waltl]